MIVLVPDQNVVRWSSKQCVLSIIIPQAFSERPQHFFVCSLCAAIASMRPPADRQVQDLLPMFAENQIQ